MNNPTHQPDTAGEALGGPAAVSLRAITRRFAGVPAVDRLDLDLRPGALTALLGPSGCGKSTTLSMIAGLAEPDSGSIHIHGQPMAGTPTQRRPVAMVFQKPLLFPHLTVAQNVAFGLRVRRLPRAQIRQRVADMLDRVQLGGFAERRVGQLSGGQEQRAALARALVLEPRILLLDEPFSQLDATLRAEMRALIRRLHTGAGLTTIFVTHDQTEAVDVADDIALMDHGRLIGHGPAPTFFTRPPSLYAARFFGVTNELPGHVADGRYRSDDGQIQIAAALPDGPATLVVRPEVLDLIAADPGHTHDTGVELAVTVDGVRFAGTHLVVHTRLPGGESLTVHTPIGRAITVGAAATIRLSADACTVFAVSATSTSGAPAPAQP